MQNGGMSGYTGIYFWNNGNPELMLFLRNNGSWTNLGAWNTGGALAAGTVLQLSATSSTITLSENGTPRISVNDTTLTGGTTGMLVNAIAPVANWAAGSAAEGTFSVGGSVSACLGGSPVVLQDNSGDTTSVSANGSFMFPTPLAPEPAYNVTRRYPAGETCAVTNGTGNVSSAAITNVAVACTSHLRPRRITSSGRTRPRWAELDRDQRRRHGHFVRPGHRHQLRRQLRWHVDRQQIHQRPVCPADRLLHPPDPLPVGRPRRPHAKRRHERLHRHLLLEQRQPRAHAVPAQQRQLDQSRRLEHRRRPRSRYVLQLSATGSTITLSENGTPRISVNDTTLTGGTAGMLVNAIAPVANWAAGSMTTGPSPTPSASPCTAVALDLAVCVAVHLPVDLALFIAVGLPDKLVVAARVVRVG